MQNIRYEFIIETKVHIRKTKVQEINLMEVFQKIKNRTTMPSNNFISGYLSEENKDINLKRCKLPHVHCNIIYNS